MEPFRRVRGGVASALDIHERLFLARPFSDVAALLGHREVPEGEDLPATPAAEEGGDAGGATRAPTDDDAVLAALDFQPTDAGPAGDRPPSDPALARLLPDMSEDEALAGELRELTEAPLRAEKIARLLAVVAELDAPSGPRGTFFVPDGTETDVLRAVNDVRLVLATRLGVGETITDEELYERAEAAGSGATDRPEAVVDAMAILYTSLTWWQESLINALRRRPRPN